MRSKDIVKLNELLIESIERDNNAFLLSVSEILDYEINSSWIASKISNKYLQKLLGSYFAWKVRRKHNRYLINKHWKKKLSSYR